MGLLRIEASLASMHALSHVHADQLLQEQTRTAAFGELWQEVGRRGAEGIGAEQKTLTQVHQVGWQGLMAGVESHK